MSRLLAHALLDNAIRRHFYRSNSHGKVFVADVLAVKLDTFIVFHKMGRGKLANLQACRKNDVGNHTAYGTLAIGTGNMHGFNLLFRIAKLTQQAFNAFHTQLDTKFTKRIQIF